MMILQSLLIAGSLLSSPAASVVPEMQSVLQNTHRSNEYKYPTDFTRGIMPVSLSCCKSKKKVRIRKYELTGGRFPFIRTSNIPSTLVPLIDIY